MTFTGKLFGRPLRLKPSNDTLKRLGLACEAILKRTSKLLQPCPVARLS